MRLVGGGGTSRVPVTSVCTSDPARLKYSESVSTWKNFGTVLLRVARASRPSVTPVSGSS